MTSGKKKSIALHGMIEDHLLDEDIVYRSRWA